MPPSPSEKDCTYCHAGRADAGGRRPIATGGDGEWHYVIQRNMLDAFICAEKRVV